MTIVARIKHSRKANRMSLRELGEMLPTETPRRMRQLIYRALAEDLISRSRA